MAPGSRRIDPLLVQEVGSTQSRVLLPDALTLGTPRWSHDGQVLVVQGRLDGDRQGLFAISRLTGTAQLIVPGGSYDTSRPTGTARLILPGGTYDTHPSADSVLLVPMRQPGKGVAFVISLASGAIADSVHLPFDWARDVSWSPDARHIAASTTNGITVVDRAGVQTGLLRISNRSRLTYGNGRLIAADLFAIDRSRSLSLVLLDFD